MQGLSEEHSKDVQTLDIRGLRYTMPLITLATTLKKASPGDKFEVISDYAGFDKDLETWCRSTRNILMGVNTTGSVISAMIKKKIA